MYELPADTPRCFTLVWRLARVGQRCATSALGHGARLPLLALLGAAGCGGNEALIIEGPAAVGGQRPSADPEPSSLAPPGPLAPSGEQTAALAPSAPAERPPASEVKGPAEAAPPPIDPAPIDPPDEPPPAEEPRPEEPPAEEPPAEEPPAEEPPVEEPPAEEPPPRGEEEPPGGDGEQDEPAVEEPEPDDDPVGAGEDGPGDGPPSSMAEFRIAVIGSSTAAGDGASDGDRAWVGLLESDLAAALTGRLSMWNFAEGGYTAYELEPGSGARGSVDDALAVRPDLLVVALAGSNDLTPEITTEKFISQLVSVRDAATAAGTPTFFMGILPKTFSQGERELLASWNQAMQQSFRSCWVPGAAAPHQACFIDVFDALASAELGLAPELDSGDGSHPNDAGHMTLYRHASAVIKPYVCARAGCGSEAAREP